MRLSDFESLVRRLSAEVPADFLAGIAEITVSPKTLPHPTKGEIYTLGECIPVAWDTDGAPGAIQSRVVLYHGSFRALALHQPDFDWREEAWETLTHELRHHLEWRARVPDLEAFDRAAEHNFARHDGERFDPLFFLDGDSPVPGVYQVDDDWFLDRVVRSVPGRVEFIWHGRRYLTEPPAGTTLPALLVVEGVDEPPPGELIVVLRRKGSVLDLFRGRSLYQAEVVAKPA